jgi:hypothetical protein
VKWLSCEPMLEPLKFSSLAMFDWVVIGASTFNQVNDNIGSRGQRSLSAV